MSDSVKYNSGDFSQIQEMGRRIASMVPQGKKVSFVCVGTDRSTGDSLGPLVGTKLKEKGYDNVFGDLDEPVHAVNLLERLQEVDKSHFVIGIDAFLGQSSSVGLIQVHDTPLRPGAGVGKELPPVGNMYIAGIVNVGGFMEYFVLQNTRLALVMKIADYIVQAIEVALYIKAQEDYNTTEITESEIA